MLGILIDHPYAWFSFDVSTGSKRFSLGLFSLSLWVEGDAYYAFGNSPTRRVPVPIFPAKNLPANPLYLVILTIFFREQEHARKASSLVPKETLFHEAKTWQIRFRIPRQDPPVKTFPD